MNQVRGYNRAQPLSVGDARSAFVTRVYGHLAGAIAAFTGIEIMLFKSGMAEVIAMKMLGFSWPLVLGAFILIGWLATRVAHQSSSLAMQYLGLGGYVVADALIFVPLLYVAQAKAGGGVIETAAYVTLLGFGALTMIAWSLRKDFSFLRGILMWGGVAALLAIGGSFLFGFNLGFYFSVAMVGLAGAAVLYDTSNVIHHYPEDRHVGAALQLFASIAMMFWYILRIFSSRD